MSALPYFFHEGIENESGHFDLDETNARHCVQVLRMQNGDEMHLTNGLGLLATAVITATGKKTCTVRLLEGIQHPAPAASYTIGISLLKNTGRFEWFLEKAAELGIHHIIPLLCTRTEKQHFRQERMKQILISALLQSRQVWLPQLDEPLAFEAAMAGIETEKRLLAHCMEGEKKFLPDVLSGWQQDACIFIGPEGDFTPAERDAALLKNWTPVSLGNQRLRTETAGVAAAVMMCLR